MIISVGTIISMPITLKEHLYHSGHEHYGKECDCLFYVKSKPAYRSTDVWVINAELIASMYMTPTCIPWELNFDKNTLFSIVQKQDLPLYTGYKVGIQFEKLLQENQ